MKKGLLFSTLLVALSLINSAHAESAQKPNIRLATTTSTQNSGLLDYLLPEFKKETGYTVDVIAVGTGKALKMGENGDVDLVMTHAPQAEAVFIQKGFGIEPRSLMYNDFVLVGPKNDPAKVKATPSVSQAFKTIAENNQGFISRGDDSGTNKKEIAIWQQVGIEPQFSNYKAIGQGMGATLNMASELQAYTLTDRGTWIAYQAKTNLMIVLEGDQILFNPYQVMLVNPERYQGLNTEGARVFQNWLVSPRGQKLINAYQLQGQQLFTANYKK